MKQTFKHISTFLGAIALMLNACEEEYKAPTPVSNHSYITTSFGAAPKRIQVGGSMTFIDLSQGVVSRQWVFPEGLLGYEPKHH